MSATQRWKAMIQVEHAQSEELRRAAPPSDHWGPYAQQFRADPDRADDPLVDLLLDKVQPQHTVIDAGAGGGRLALPLARHCQHVTAVEPSPSMGEVLLQQAQEYGIQNVSLVPARWEEAQVEPADVVLCSHVVYVVQDIGPFVRKLTDHARRLTLVVMYNAPPQSQIYPLWPLVHGQERLPLPSLPEFQEVLGELGIPYRLETLPPQPARGFDSREQALEQLTRRLYAEGDAEKQARLQQALADGLEEDGGAFHIRGAAPLQPTIVVI